MGSGAEPQLKNKVMISSVLGLADAKLRSGSGSPNHRSSNYPYAMTRSLRPGTPSLSRYFATVRRATG